MNKEKQKGSVVVGKCDFALNYHGFCLTEGVSLTNGYAVFRIEEGGWEVSHFRGAHTNPSLHFLISRKKCKVAVVECFMGLFSSDSNNTQKKRTLSSNLSFSMQKMQQKPNHAKPPL